MKRFIVVVLDGFGIGEMEDTKIVRPKDIGANTFKHILEETNIYLPTLEKLGICNAVEFEVGDMKFSNSALFGKCNLMHFGADTFYGHQEIMGSTPKKPLKEPFSEAKERVKKRLISNGYKVKEYGNEAKVLVIDDCVTVGDNLEADLGQVYNITGSLDLISFDELIKIGKIVRESVYTSRVITFGGENVSLEDLLNAYEEKEGMYAGINAPRSGVYNKGYQVIHLGYGVDPNTQVPTILGKNNVKVYLFGKVADIVENNYGISIPGVDTAEVFDQLIQKIKENESGFFCLNVQESDLAGHQQSSEKYAKVLKISDYKLKQLINILDKDDMLIVMADHGNDPTIGHSQHTREQVPVLVYNENIKPGYMGELKTLADIGATAIDYFGLEGTENGASFLDKIVITTKS